MPATSPPSGPRLKKLLRDLGKGIRDRRKKLKVSAVAAAEAAGISRMTLNRIEHGEASVTMGAYLNAISVLGLALDLSEAQLKKNELRSIFKIPEKIRLADYPVLKSLAWQLKGTTVVSAQEAFDIYERNWRHVDLEKMKSREKELIQGLIVTLGKGKLLV